MEGQSIYRALDVFDLQAAGHSLGYGFSSFLATGTSPLSSPPPTSMGVLGKRARSTETWPRLVLSVSNGIESHRTIRRTGYCSHPDRELLPIQVDSTTNILDQIYGVV